MVELYHIFLVLSSVDLSEDKYNIFPRFYSEVIAALFEQTFLIIVSRKVGWAIGDHGWTQSIKQSWGKFVSDAG